MKKIQVKNEQGAAVGEIELDPQVFGVPVKPEVVHEAVVAQQANARVQIAHVKTRDEVRGGGKKPWRQKGTGRARHGSIRSPIWVGGGVTHGPRPERNFGQRINRKKRSLAIRMALSDKAGSDAIMVMDTLAFPEFKTKRMAGIIKTLGLGGKKTLLVLPGKDERTLGSARNLPKVTVRNAGNLNVVDLVNHLTLLTTSLGVKKITELFTPRR